MARYGTFKYSAETYGKTTTGIPNNILYALHVDWDGDGSYDGDYNEAFRVLSWSVDRGRDTVFNPSGDGFTPYGIGTMRVLLDNKDGRYDSWNTSSPLYNNLMPGKKVQFRVGVTSIAEERVQHTAYCQASQGDGYIMGSDVGYKNARATATNVFTDSDYLNVGQRVTLLPQVYRSFLRFDTSVIPTDATIDQVNMRLTCAGDYSTTDFNVEIIKQDWSAYDPLSSTNMESAYDACLAGTTDSAIWRSTSGISTDTAYDSGNLDTSWVVAGGDTYYSLISSRDRGNVEPTESEFIQIYSADYRSMVSGRNPFLIVKYTPTPVNYHYVFTGIVTDIQLNGYRNTATLICEDGWRLLADTNYFRAPATVGDWDYYGEFATILENESVRFYDYWLWDLPFEISYERLPRHYWWDGTTKSVIEMITFGSLGRANMKTDGSFKYKRLDQSDDSPVAVLNEESILHNIYLPNAWENVRNKIILKGSERHWDNRQYRGVASLDNPFLVPAGETKDFILRLSSTDTDDPFYCTRVQYITHSAWTGSDGTGTDLTSYFKVGYTPFIDSISVTATNQSSTDGYLTQCDVIGELLRVEETQWVHESTSNYNATFTLESDWLSITDEFNGTYYSDTETTTNDKNRIAEVGQTLQTYLGSVRPYPVIQLLGRHETQFSLELEDKITLTLPTYGIDQNFRIHKISHETLTGLQGILTTLWLYPVLEIPFM